MKKKRRAGKDGQLLPHLKKNKKHTIQKIEEKLPA